MSMITPYFYETADALDVTHQGSSSKRRVYQRESGGSLLGRGPCRAPSCAGTVPVEARINLYLVVARQGPTRRDYLYLARQERPAGCDAP